MHLCFRSAAAVAAAIALAGCASLPRERGYAETGDLVAARRGAAPIWPAVSPSSQPVAPALPTHPLSVDEAVQLAFLYSPGIGEAYARIGIGRAELEEARRIANPGIGYSRSRPDRGGGSQITRSLSLGFTDLLLLPARKRFAEGELDRLQKSVAAELLALAAEVETAWFGAVSANQIAAMRDIVAQSAEQSAVLAQRFFDAGNISALQLEQERAAATQARISAVRAKADGLRARAALASLIGLPVEMPWTTLDRMPAPPASEFNADQLLQLALQQRLDLAAAHQELVLREEALGVSRRWRWLGAVELDYERESELDGGVLRGPSLSLELPLFNQGQGAISRAQAELLDVRARLAGLILSVHNETRLELQGMAVARDIAERYRSVLLPSREAIVARSQQEVNFMLMGVFELIVARQQEYDAYQEYLEAVRDYWIARAELRRVVGGRLPDDDVELQPVIGVESMLPASQAPAMDHSMHGARAGDQPAAVDPHAGHDMSRPASEAVPVKESATTDHAPHDHAQHDHGDTP